MKSQLKQPTSITLLHDTDNWLGGRLTSLMDLGENCITNIDVLNVELTETFIKLRLKSKTNFFDITFPINGYAIGGIIGYPRGTVQFFKSDGKGELCYRDGKWRFKWL